MSTSDPPNDQQNQAQTNTSSAAPEPGQPAQAGDAAAAAADPWTRREAAAETKASVISPPPGSFGGQGAGGGASWEKETIDRLLFAAIREQQRSRRWSIGLKLGFFAYLVFITYAVMTSDIGTGDGVSHGKHTALVDVQGVIAEDSQASADLIISGLRAAFKDKNTAGVILRINSPGGSPVQAGYVNDEIVRLREKYQNVPLYAVIVDVCASGGYYIAAAADEIYADKASMVGSIGVLMDGFGFTEAMKKLGVERRLLTAGVNKGFLDPFSKLKEEDVMHVKNMLGNIHQQFIDTVKDGRGSRLKETPDLFSGLVWTGEQSLELGLIDGLGNTGYVARELIGQEEIVDYTPRPNYFDRFADRLGVAMANTLAMVMGLRNFNLQ